MFKDREDHDRQEALVQMSRSDRKDIDFRVNDVADTRLFRGFSLEDSNDDFFRHRTARLKMHNYMTYLFFSDVHVPSSFSLG